MRKELTDKIDAKQIVREAGMSARPEYYSGRGATTSDLNSDILEKVYNGIEKAHGEKAGKAFVNMVADTPKLSATDFLLNLYRLEGYNWEWNKKMSGNENGVYVDGPTDKAKYAIGMITIAHVMSGLNDRDDTDYIRGNFLRSHSVEDKKLIDKQRGFY
jgi:hypothetical protein